jgi:hypothetical protein
MPKLITHIFKSFTTMLTSHPPSDIERYINSRDPKTTSDVEHLIMNYTYSKDKNFQ